MFRLAGENDAESIFWDSRGGVLFPIKNSRVFSYPRRTWRRGWGWGFNTPSQSLVDAYEQRCSKSYYHFCRDIIWWRVVPSTETWI
jgi:hypothetical protein